MRRGTFGGAAAALVALSCGVRAPEELGSIREPALHATESELVPADGAPNLAYGSVGFDGTTAIVGATASDTAAAGYVYLFTRVGGAFAQQAMVTAGQKYLSSSFGAHVAVDGDRAVVSSFSSAFVLARTGSTWASEQELPSESGISDVKAVAIGGDAVVVGTPALNMNAGDARVFRRNGTSWTLEATLVADNSAAAQYFGAALAIRKDVVLVGAPANFDDTFGYDTDPPGAVYVFHHDSSGWQPVQKLAASDASNGDLFGASLAYDGTTLVVGAPGADGGGQDVGAVYVFGTDASGFVEQARIDNFTTGADVNGYRVAVDGARLLNSPYPGAFPGFADVFTQSSSGWDDALLVKSSGDNGGFGKTMSLHGGTLLVGADGHAYAFELQGDGLCSADGTSLDPGDGNFVSCSPYLCAAGACLTACTDSTACATGYVCDRAKGQGTCVRNASKSDSSGGCAFPQGRSPGGAAAIGVLLAAWAWRRRRERGLGC